MSLAACVRISPASSTSVQPRSRAVSSCVGTLSTAARLHPDARPEIPRISSAQAVHGGGGDCRGARRRGERELERRPPTSRASSRRSSSSCRVGRARRRPCAGAPDGGGSEHAAGGRRAGVGLRAGACLGYLFAPLMGAFRDERRAAGGRRRGVVAVLRRAAAADACASLLALLPRPSARLAARGEIVAVAPEATDAAAPSSSAPTPRPSAAAAKALESKDFGRGAAARWCSSGAADAPAAGNDGVDGRRRLRRESARQARGSALRPVRAGAQGGGAAIAPPPPPPPPTPPRRRRRGRRRRRRCAPGPAVALEHDAHAVADPLRRRHGSVRPVVRCGSPSRARAEPHAPPRRRCCRRRRSLPSTAARAAAAAGASP